MTATTLYTATVDGHEVELEFDTSRVVLNKATLRVDGRPVDSDYIFYGESDLRTRLPDGTEVEVAVHSGMIGELTRAQVRTGDDSWVDLVAR